MLASFLITEVKQREQLPQSKKKSKNFPAKDHLARELAAELANLET